VVDGHGVLDPDSSPRHIEETRRYIRDFNEIAASTSTATELARLVSKPGESRFSLGCRKGRERMSKGVRLAGMRYLLSGIRMRPGSVIHNILHLVMHPSS